MARRWSERGAAAVEFALIAPAVLTLAVGIMEFSRVFNTQAVLSAAAREGVRTMALSSSPSAARTSAKNAATNLGLTDGQIAVTPSTCTTAETQDATAKVTITYNFVFVTGMFGSGLTLSGVGAMRCNG